VRGGGGGPSLRGLARTIAAKSYKNVHDGGGSVHRHVFSSSVRGTRSLDPSASGRGTPPRGMRKSGTALLLGELLQATDASISGSEPSYKAGMKRAQTVGQLAPLGSAPSGLQLFAASVRQYVEVSVHGGKGRSPSRGGSSTGGNLSGMGADVSGSGSGRRAESVDRTVRGGSVHGRAAIDRELLKVYQVKRGSLDGNSSVSARSVRSTDSGSAWVKPAGQEGTPKRKVLALAPL